MKLNLKNVDNRITLNSPEKQGLKPKKAKKLHRQKIIRRSGGRKIKTKISQIPLLLNKFNQTTPGILTIIMKVSLIWKVVN